MHASRPLLKVSNLTVEFPLRDGVTTIRAVDNVSFDVARGTTLGIVGESGSGKSVLVRSVMRILEAPGRIRSGAVEFNGTDLLGLSESDMRAIRGRDMAMIFQNPAGSLNPVATIGSQFIETIRAHERAGKRAAIDRSMSALEAVGIERPEVLLRKRPYEIAGGLIQRVMIGLALVTGPSLILADEPTTNLDSTVQKQIITALRKLQQEYGTTIIFISHDIGVISEISDRIMVMYAGRTVETGSFLEVLTSPLHPYSDGLIGSVPPLDMHPGMRLRAIPGQPPDLSRLAAGCRFQERCSRAEDRCTSVDPPLAEAAPRRMVACHYPLLTKKKTAETVQ